MKTIFYILSVLVIGTAAYFSFDNSNKLQGEIDLFESKRGVKRTTETAIEKQEGILKDTKQALDTAQTLNAELIAEMENMKSREVAYNKSKEAAQVKIDEADAQLEQLAAIKAEIDKALEGVDVDWPQIPSEIKRLQELRKKKFLVSEVCSVHRAAAKRRSMVK